MQNNKLRAMLVGALALAPMVVGCGDGSPTGPGSEFDPQSTAQVIDAISGSVEDNTALVHLQLAGEALGAAVSGGAAIAPPLEGYSLLGQPQLHRTLAASAASAPIFPSNFLGKTFVWDPVGGRYTLDEELPGAPATGIRFLLYTLDPATRRPAEPLEVIGYLDLTDESGPSSTRLAVQAVDTSGAADLTLLDYFIDGSATVTEEEISVHFLSEGFVSNGADELLFSMDQSVGISAGLESFTISADHEISAPSLGTSVALSIDGEVTGENEGTLSVRLTVEEGADSSLIDVQVTDEAIDGFIEYNGQTVLVLSGDPDNPTFKRPDGTAPTSADLEALEQIWSTVEALEEFAAELFQPLSELLGVAEV